MQHPVSNAKAKTNNGANCRIAEVRPAQNALAQCATSTCLAEFRHLRSLLASTIPQNMFASLSMMATGRRTLGMPGTGSSLHLSQLLVETTRGIVIGLRPCRNRPWLFTLHAHL